MLCARLHCPEDERPLIDVAQEAAADGMVLCFPSRRGPFALWSAKRVPPGWTKLGVRRKAPK